MGLRPDNLVAQKIETHPMAEQILQVFEGFIESIDQVTGLSTVRLQDVTVPSNPEERAEIDFSTVTKNIEVVQEGYLFTWRIGHVLDDAGEPGEGFSEFVFVTKTWTAEEIASVREEGAALAGLFK